MTPRRTDVVASSKPPAQQALAQTAKSRLGKAAPDPLAARPKVHGTRRNLLAPTCWLRWRFPSCASVLVADDLELPGGQAVRSRRWGMRAEPAR